MAQAKLAVKISQALSHSINLRDTVNLRTLGHRGDAFAQGRAALEWQHWSLPQVLGTVTEYTAIPPGKKTEGVRTQPGETEPRWVWRGDFTLGIRRTLTYKKVGKDPQGKYYSKFLPSTALQSPASIFHRINLREAGWQGILGNAECTSQTPALQSRQEKEQV